MSILSWKLRWLLVIVIASAAMLWVLYRGTPEDSVSASSAGDVGSSPGRAIVAPPTPNGSSGHRRAAGEPEPSSLTTDDSESSTPAESPSAFDAFRSELESTLFQRMNPGVLLAEAQRIADSDASLKSNPQPTVDGATRFDFVDGPVGVIAGLEISRSAKYASVLTLEVQCDQQDPMFLQGAYRQSPTLRVKVWSDSDGKPSNMAMTTEFAPAYRESLNAGIDINQGATICGLRYNLDVKDPSKSSMKLLVMNDGLLTTEDVPMILDGGEPEIDNVEQFASTLLALQQSLNN